MRRSSSGVVPEIRNSRCPAFKSGNTCWIRSGPVVPGEKLLNRHGISIVLFLSVSIERLRISISFPPTSRQREKRPSGS